MERVTRIRAIVFLSLFCLVLVLYAGRLFKLQIIETDGNNDNTTTYTTLTTVRARMPLYSTWAIFASRRAYLPWATATFSSAFRAMLRKMAVSSSYTRLSMVFSFLRR